MIKALVIKTSGDPAICRAVAESFESDELRHLRLENSILRKNRDALRRFQVEALTREVEEYLYGRRVIWRVKRAFWRISGDFAKGLEAKL